MFILSLTHVLLFAPCLFYIGLKRASTPLWAFQALFIVGAFILLYHLSRYIYTGSYINLIHILIVAPLFIFIGYRGRDSTRSAYEMLLMVTFAMVGWHTLNLIRSLELHSETAMKLQDL
jgi:hypothetical protein